MTKNEAYEVCEHLQGLRDALFGKRLDREKVLRIDKWITSELERLWKEFPSEGYGE